MKAIGAYLNRIVAALVTVFLSAGVVFADDTKLDQLFTELKNADEAGSHKIEQEIWNEWSKSGSPAMDLLLQRGRDAMEAGDIPQAIEHFTALVDHAPDFAEGWNARATAYFLAGKFGPSVADIGHVLTLNPRHFGALAGLGAIYEEIGNPKKALEVYRAALAIHPHFGNVSDSVKRLEKAAGGTDL